MRRSANIQSREERDRARERERRKKRKKESEREKSMWLKITNRDGFFMFRHLELSNLKSCLVSFSREDYRT